MDDERILVGDRMKMPPGPADRVICDHAAGREVLMRAGVTDSGVSPTPEDARHRPAAVDCHSEKIAAVAAAA